MAVRVLWVIKGLGPGGAENLLLNSAAVHDRVRFDIECVFVLPHKDHLAERIAACGVPTACLSRRRRDLIWPFRLWSRVRHGEYDIVHVHSPLPGSVVRLALCARRKTQTRIVTTEHNRWSTFALPTRLLNRVTSLLDSGSFAVSDEVRESMRGRVGRRTVTLVHGIDVEAVSSLREERNAVRSELGIGVTDFVIGTVANFREQKDYPTLLRAVRRVLDDGHRVQWVIVGQGPLEAEIRRLSSELGLDDVVHFCGYRSDAARVLSSFDVFTLASRWEGLPVAMMEACALGRPIVSTAVGGVAELLSDGESALLVPPGDPGALAAAWQRLLNDNELRAKLGVASSNLSSKFDAHRAQTVIEEMYLSLSRASVAAASPVSRSSTRSSSQVEGVSIRPLDAADDDSVLCLLARSMGRSDDPRFGDLYRWKHLENPFGRSFGWVATAGHEVVAVRLFMRWKFTRGSQTLNCVRAVDTATDPRYQGRGIFTALTLHGVEQLEREGIDFVFNTPNAQSLPGYLKMGWSVLGRLPIRVGVPTVSAGIALARNGRGTAAEHWSTDSPIGEPVSGEVCEAAYAQWAESEAQDIRTSWTADFLRWRFGGPVIQYRYLSSPDGGVFVRTRRRGHAVEMCAAATLGRNQHSIEELLLQASRRSNADYWISIGREPVSWRSIPLPSVGPRLAWRALNSRAEPPLPNWRLTLGDIELF